LLFFTLLVCPLLFTRQTLEVFEYPKSLLLRAVAIVLLAGGLAHAVLRFRRGGMFGSGTGVKRALRDPIVLGVLLFLFSAGVSTCWSTSRLTSLFGAEESYGGLLTIASYALLFFAIRAVCRQAGHFRDLLAATGLATLIAGAYAIVQALKLDPLGWQRTHAFLGVERAFATFGNPTFLGGFMATALPLVAYLALRAAKRGPRPALLLWGPTAVVALAALGVTLARGAWLGTAVGALVLAAGLLRSAATPQARRRLLLAGGALLILATAGVAFSPRARGVLGAMLGRIALTMQSKPQERPEAGLSFEQEPRPAMWRVAWSLFQEHPIAGVGLDAFQLAYLKERSAAIWRVEGNRTPQRAHNELLHTLATQGALGGAALALLAVGVASGVRRAARLHPTEIDLLVAAVAALVALAVHVSFSFTTVPLGLLAVTLLALVSRLAQPADGEAPPEGERVPTGRVLALAALPAALALHVLVLRPLRADLLAQTGKLQEAQRFGSSLVALGRAVQLDPLRDHLWARLGVAYANGADTLRGTGQRAAWLDQARQAFEQARALVPQNSYHHMSRARILLEQAQEHPARTTPQECLAAFEDVLRLDPNNPFMYAEAGRAALGLGDTPRLQRWSARCLEIDPDYGACRWLAARKQLDDAAHAAVPGSQRLELLAAAGYRLREAALARWYGDDFRQAEAASQGAAALLMAERFSDGIQLAETAILKNPKYADARYNLAKGYERTGRLAEAAASYREALRIDPGHAESRRALDALSQRPAPRPASPALGNP